MGDPRDGANEVEVDVKIMRQEAKLWDSSAQDMNEAANTARGMPLDQPTWSFAGDDACQAYQDIQQWLAGMLNSASQNLRDMAQGLDATADNYERQDKESAGNFARLYPS